METSMWQWWGAPDRITGPATGSAGLAPVGNVVHSVSAMKAI